MESTAREVKVGDTIHRITPFRGFKGELALEIVSHVTQETQDVLEHVAQFERNWHQQNTLKITRDLCLRKAADFRAAAGTAEQLVAGAPEEAKEVAEGEKRKKTRAELEAEQRLFTGQAEAWEQQARELGDRPFVEVPDPDGPPEYELVLAGFEKAFALARNEVKQLLALVVIPNAELQRADEEDRVTEALKELGKRLFYEGQIGELMELTVAAAEVLEAEIQEYRSTVGKLQALYDRASGRSRSKGAKEQQEEPSPEASASPTDSPTGSTSSPPPTDGAATTSSGELVGASSSPSASE